MTSLQIEHKSIQELLAYQNNNKKHPPEQIRKIAASIKEFGFKNPVLIDSNNVIIAGHGRVTAAKTLRYDSVPCIVIDDLTPEQIKAFRIMDNKSAESEYDFDALATEFQSLLESDYDLTFTGFDPEEVQGILGEPETVEEVEADDADTIQTDIQVGDIFTIGQHRLMCGDSTDYALVKEKLCENKVIDLVLTDPPYGINEKGDRSNRGGLTSGNKLHDFKDDTIDYAVKAFQICDKLNISRQVWWGANYYCHHIPQSNNWFVWDKRVEEKQKDTQSDCELAWVKSKWSSVRIFRHLWKGLIKESEQGIRRVHPTQKPIALMVWCIEYYKDNLLTVLDLFGGSGSTMVACEQLNRKCYMMELDPKYCQVIINRMRKLNPDIEVKCLNRDIKV